MLPERDFEQFINVRRKKWHKCIKGDTKLKTLSKYFLGSVALNEVYFGVGLRAEALRVMFK